MERDKPQCVECGRPAKFRGDRVGDHEMGDMYYQRCGGFECLLTQSLTKALRRGVKTVGKRTN